MGTREIVSQRLVLRALRVDDAEQMFAHWANDPEVTRYLSWPAHQAVETVRQRLEERQVAYQRDDFYDWGIEEKASGRLIGTITVVDQQPEIGVAEIGYVLGRSFWGQGFATEAMQAVIAYLFATTDVQRIEAFHDVANPASGQVMKKNKLSFEGILRQRGRNQRGIVDLATYAILRSDFQKTE